MSKHQQHTPASAAVGIEHAIRMLEGRWKLVILFHLFGGRKLRFSDLERATLCPALDELLTWAERQPSSPSGSQSAKASRPPRG